MCWSHMAIGTEIQMSASSQLQTFSPKNCKFQSRQCASQSPVIASGRLWVGVHQFPCGAVYGSANLTRQCCLMRRQFARPSGGADAALCWSHMAIGTEIQISASSQLQTFFPKNCSFRSRQCAPQSPVIASGRPGVGVHQIPRSALYGSANLTHQCCVMRLQCVHPSGGADAALCSSHKAKAPRQPSLHDCFA